MIAKEQLREDLYKAIIGHYEKCDFTEALRDAMFFIRDVLQEKSGYVDKDNTSLVEASLLGKNPAIRINKFETQAEKDFQEGIGYALKGLVMHLRNRISHEKIQYGENEADAQLLYINYLLNQIDKSSGRQLITDWLEYLKGGSFTSSKLFAQELIKELPKKQQYDLLVSIWRERYRFKQNSITHFVEELVGKLSSQEKSNFVNVMNSDLINDTEKGKLASMFCFFAKHFYSSLKTIVKLHVEDIVKRGIEEGTYVDGYILEDNSMVAAFACKYIDLFVTKEDIVNAIRKRFLESDSACDYIQCYFSKYVDLENSEVFYALKDDLKKHLTKGDKYIYDIIEKYRQRWNDRKEQWESSAIYCELSKEIEICKSKIDAKKQEEYDDMPF